MNSGRTASSAIATFAPADPSARICSYECTFCDDCVQHTLKNVCPNCGGGFVPRPIRPRQSWRTETGLEHDPPGDRRRKAGYSPEQIAELVERLHAVPPAQR